MSDKRTGIERAIDHLGGGSRGLVAIAYHLGVSSQVVWKWKRMRGVPLTKYCAELSTLTGVPMSELVPTVGERGGGGEPPSRAKRLRRGLMAPRTTCSMPPLRPVPARARLAS